MKNNRAVDSSSEYDLFVQTGITTPLQYYNQRQFSYTEKEMMSDVFKFIGINFRFSEVK